MKKLIDINFNEMLGNSLNFRNNDELKELVGLFAKKLKLKKYSFYISDLTIHITTKKYFFDITEKQTDKFTIVKEDFFNNRELKYMQLM